ncbi:hypothetical protein SD81_040875 [Tolypothrix campylonemoides VB511288]|nr:hypothetical protein SD81_040875 [Tolypothrix campylonemoides VB511288]
MVSSPLPFPSTGAPIHEGSAVVSQRYAGGLARTHSDCRSPFGVSLTGRSALSRGVSHRCAVSPADRLRQRVASPSGEGIRVPRHKATARPTTNRARYGKAFWARPGKVRNLRVQPKD